MDTVPKSPAAAPATSGEIAVEAVQPTTEVPNAVDVEVGGTSGAAEGTTSKGDIGTPEAPQLDAKRGRGRPKGTGKLKNQAPLGGLLAETAAAGFNPYVLTVHEGEDIAQKILLFNEIVSGSSVVLAAVGPVCRVKLSEAEYEGDFEIIFMSASHTTGSTGKTITMLSIELVDTYGKLFGGAVTGPVIAAAPVQIIMGGFIQEKKKKRKVCGTSSLRPIPEADETDETAKNETPEDQIPEDLGVQPDNEPDTNKNSEQAMPPSAHAEIPLIPSSNGEKTNTEEIAVDPIISSAFQDQRLEGDGNVGTTQDEKLQDHCSGKLQD